MDLFSLKDKVKVLLENKEYVDIVTISKQILQEYEDEDFEYHYDQFEKVKLLNLFNDLLVGCLELKNEEVSLRIARMINGFFFGVRYQNNPEIISNLGDCKINIDLMKIPVRVINDSSNYGDAITLFLIENLFKVKINSKRLWDPNVTYEHYITVGSILHFSNEYSHIWGSGFIEQDSFIDKRYKNSKPEAVKKPKKIYCVRGPLTRQKLLDDGIICPEVYGDPAILLPLVYNPLKVELKYKYGIIPHFTDKKHPVIMNLSSEVHFIDINSGYKPFQLIDEILKCETIISSSLHGLIVAIAYKKPCIWIKMSKLMGDSFKFNDFFTSLDYDSTSSFVDLSNDVKLNLEDLEKNIVKITDDKLYKLGVNLIISNPFSEDSEKASLLLRWGQYNLL